MSYKKVLASEIGVNPAYVTSMEAQGLCYFSSEEYPIVGAQCPQCHTVVWVNSRINKILSEKRPANIPPSGREYVDYHDQKLERFLSSLPPCPECGNKRFDKFINNVKFPRLQDGTPLPKDKTGLRSINVDNTKVQVWLYDEN